MDVYTTVPHTAHCTTFHGSFCTLVPTRLGLRFTCLPHHRSGSAGSTCVLHYTRHAHARLLVRSVPLRLVYSPHRTWVHRTVYGSVPLRFVHLHVLFTPFWFLPRFCTHHHTTHTLTPPHVLTHLPPCGLHCTCLVHTFTDHWFTCTHTGSSPHYTCTGLVYTYLSHTTGSHLFIWVCHVSPAHWFTTTGYRSVLDTSHVVLWFVTVSGSGSHGSLPTTTLHSHTPTHHIFVCLVPTPGFVTVHVHGLRCNLVFTTFTVLILTVYTGYAVRTFYRFVYFTVPLPVPTVDSRSPRSYRHGWLPGFPHTSPVPSHLLPGLFCTWLHTSPAPHVPHLTPLPTFPFTRVTFTRSHTSTGSRSHVGFWLDFSWLHRFYCFTYLTLVYTFGSFTHLLVLPILVHGSFYLHVYTTLTHTVPTRVFHLSHACTHTLGSPPHTTAPLPHTHHTTTGSSGFLHHTPGCSATHILHTCYWIWIWFSRSRLVPLRFTPQFWFPQFTRLVHTMVCWFTRFSHPWVGSLRTTLHLHTLHSHGPTPHTCLHTTFWVPTPSCFDFQYGSFIHTVHFTQFTRFLYGWVHGYGLRFTLHHTVHHVRVYTRLPPLGSWLVRLDLVLHCRFPGYLHAAHSFTFGLIPHTFLYCILDHTVHVHTTTHTFTRSRLDLHGSFWLLRSPRSRFGYRLSHAHVPPFGYIWIHTRLSWFLVRLHVLGSFWRFPTRSYFTAHSSRTTTHTPRFTTFLFHSSFVTFITFLTWVLLYRLILHSSWIGYSTFSWDLGSVPSWIHTYTRSPDTQFLLYHTTVRFWFLTVLPFTHTFVHCTHVCGSVWLHSTVHHHTTYRFCSPRSVYMGWFTARSFTRFMPLYAYYYTAWDNVHVYTPPCYIGSSFTAPRSAFHTVHHVRSTPWDYPFATVHTAFLVHRSFCTGFLHTVHCTSPLPHRTYRTCTAFTLPGPLSTTSVHHRVRIFLFAVLLVHVRSTPYCTRYRGPHTGTHVHGSHALYYTVPHHLHIWFGSLRTYHTVTYRSLVHAHYTHHTFVVHHTVLVVPTGLISHVTFGLDHLPLHTLPAYQFPAHTPAHHLRSLHLGWSFWTYLHTRFVPPAVPGFVARSWFLVHGCYHWTTTTLHLPHRSFGSFTFRTRFLVYTVGHVLRTLRFTVHTRSTVYHFYTVPVGFYLRSRSPRTVYYLHTTVYIFTISCCLPGPHTPHVTHFTTHTHTHHTTFYSSLPFQLVHILWFLHWVGLHTKLHSSHIPSTCLQFTGFLLRPHIHSPFLLHRFYTGSPVLILHGSGSTTFLLQFRRSYIRSSTTPHHLTHAFPDYTPPPHTTLRFGILSTTLLVWFSSTTHHCTTFVLDLHHTTATLHLPTCGWDHCTGSPLPTGSTFHTLVHHCTGSALHTFTPCTTFARVHTPRHLLRFTWFFSLPFTRPTSGYVDFRTPHTTP